MRVWFNTVDLSGVETVMGSTGDDTLTRTMTDGGGFDAVTLTDGLGNDTLDLGCRDGGR